MYTCSNLLSPQGDDLARGLLNFEGLPLDETVGSGYEERAVAHTYRGRKIPTIICSLKKRKGHLG